MSSIDYLKNTHVNMHFVECTKNIELVFIRMIFLSKLEFLFVLIWHVNNSEKMKFIVCRVVIEKNDEFKISHVEKIMYFE